MTDDKKPGDSTEDDVAVNIMTPSGFFPSEDTLKRVSSGTAISDVLQEAATQLDLTNTADWLLKTQAGELDRQQTFKKAHLRCIVDLIWQPREGGGGA